MIFEITTTETLTRHDTIEANSEDEAQEKARKRYETDADYQCDQIKDFESVEFEIG